MDMQHISLLFESAVPRVSPREASTTVKTWRDVVRIESSILEKKRAAMACRPQCVDCPYFGPSSSVDASPVHGKIVIARAFDVASSRPVGPLGKQPGVYHKVCAYTVIPMNAGSAGTAKGTEPLPQASVVNAG